MKVLHVIESMCHGGAEWVVAEHVRNAGRDVEPLVCALNYGGPALDAAASFGARTFVIRKGSRRIAAIGRLAKLMRDERIAVVNGHDPTGSLYGTLAAARAGVRAIFRTEHLEHYPGRHSWIYPVLEAWTTRRTNRIICVSESVRKSHVQRYQWAAERFITVPNGIPPITPVRRRDEVRFELGLRAHHQVVLTVGRLAAQKAQHVLIEAFAAVVRGNPDARLVVVGDGRLRGSLQELIHQLGLAKVVSLLGARDDVAELMGAADVFALSSIREGLPLTVLEAMRAGLPAVVTDAGGTKEAVVNGQTGLVVPVGDREGLARAMGRLLSDRALAATLGAAAQQRWAEHFVAERMVRETEALYRAALVSDGTSIGMRTAVRDGRASP